MKKQYCFLSLLIAICAVATIASANESESDKLFVGVRYKYAEYSSQVKGDIFNVWARCRTNTTSELLTGTFWTLATQEGPVYVTAAHILHINTRPEAGECPRKIGMRRIVGKSTRAYIGFLGYEIYHIGIIPGVRDLAFMRPRRNKISRAPKTLPLATTPPQVRDVVSFFGFPSTDQQQVESGKVTSVHEAQGYFVLNRPVDGGFSGGPVFNSEGNVYGIITSTDEGNRQTTVVRLTESMLPKIEWHPLSYFDEPEN